MTTRKPASFKNPQTATSITDLTHPQATRKNIPTAEHQAVMQPHELALVQVVYPRAISSLAGLVEEKAQRNPDLDPQLVWRGKEGAGAAENLTVHAPPLYIQEKVKPKALIDDLRRASKNHAPQPDTVDLFGDFNGLPEGAEHTDFYQHEGHWQNRMILGDSLQVMASLAEREGLRGKVQCIYLDPPYGIKFNSNFQWSTTSRDVKDGKAEHITREPEQVKAFRDTWRDGIHSYLSYLRDRLIVARDLLSDSGSIFVQIGDENVHRVRCLMDEVLGEENFVSQIFASKTGSQTGNFIGNVADIILWYAKNKGAAKFRPIYGGREEREKEDYSPDPIKSAGNPSGEENPFEFEGVVFKTSSNEHWKTHLEGLSRLAKAGRIVKLKTALRYKRYFQDYPVKAINNLWADLGGATDMVYVVQTATRMIERCLLMSTDPGDLVLDPTCGSGTTAYVAEQWGRRWITIDTSRVALALARARIMGARYPYYLLADSREGQRKEAELTQSAPSTQPTYGHINHGFVYERVPHITLKSIANNEAIDTIWEKYQKKMEPLRAKLNAALNANLQEWEIPRQDYPQWSLEAYELHQKWWKLRMARQKDIDAAIAARAEFETLYDKPYEDKKRVRVAGPFTVESLAPHRVLAVDENEQVMDPTARVQSQQGHDFVGMILEQLKIAGVQQAHKEDKIQFIAFSLWPGELICAEGHYQDSAGELQRAAIFIGPEFGTVTRADLVDAAREAAEGGFEVLIACAFNYDAPTSELGKLGRILILKARMNADLHMAEDLKNTGAGNLFVIFGEPDVEVQDTQGGSLRHYDGQRDSIRVPEDGQLVVKICGVDVFHPATGQVRSHNTDGIACWLLDTDYNEESFFVRHAYFLGAGDPYKALKTTLKADIDAAAWASLHSDTSRPFPIPASGRFAVKVINHLGDEVMKVFRVQ